MFIKEWVKGESKWHVGWIHSIIVIAILQFLFIGAHKSFPVYAGQPTVCWKCSADTQLIIAHRCVAKTATLYRLLCYALKRNVLYAMLNLIWPRTAWNPDFMQLFWGKGFRQMAVKQVKLKNISGLLKETQSGTGGKNECQLAIRKRKKKNVEK